ncbi:pyrroline-5-carboxylate reductase [Methanoculleus sp. FWC-SCC1]|uniref:Pyrroline-5-carboxylate reductase n=1 Tax=Methanoculleus frigidifontis TaxID=2584085 RepID=A0ABT8M7X8_9EURY|nr:NAD(P)-binding domain-containing protein [Methanoculleus sp. FWC-SCC1]MDN7024035.1 pyrroline-5-carboxylate reductase [Methanoculleus sp. FWC-SCC1]
MDTPSVGFIGGGRVARIILSGWEIGKAMPERVIVSDASPAALAALTEQFPSIEAAGNDNTCPASADIVVLGLHPPAVGAVLQAIAQALQEEALLVSLAPKWKIAGLAEGLGGRPAIARMNPNAPAAVGEGYNPVAFSAGVTDEQKQQFERVFGVLGRMPEVAEEKLEAYAILTAMGPTYFWFQWYELLDLARSFGLSGAEAGEGLAAMVEGALRTMQSPGLAPDIVTDLVPVRPIAAGEEAIREIYRTNLIGLYRKLTE